MVFLRKLAQSLRDESGAVTVDWVVLTAALVLMGVAAVAIYRPALSSSATYVNDTIVDVGATLNTPST
jgi:hypothetical protein